MMSHTIIALISFDKAPTVDIDDLSFLASFAPKHVEAANVLTKRLTDFRRVFLFLLT
jgi:hypothetical protein